MNLSMHETLTISLAMQHEELPEYVHVGISCKNSYKDTTVMIGVDRSNLAGVVTSHSGGHESILAGYSPKYKLKISGQLRNWIVGLFC